MLKKINFTVFTAVIFIQHRMHFVEDYESFVTLMTNRSKETWPHSADSIGWTTLLDLPIAFDANWLDLKVKTNHVRLLSRETAECDHGSFLLVSQLNNLNSKFSW